MTDYIFRIYGQVNTGITPEDIISFITDGVYFEPHPHFETEKKDNSNWKITIQYDQHKDPVAVSTYEGDPSAANRIKEVQFILKHSKKSKPKELIESLLETVQIVYTIKINQEEVTDECWQMLDSLEAFLMRSCDGVLHTGDNEFYDKNLRKFYKL